MLMACVVKNLSPKTMRAQRSCLVLAYLAEQLVVVILLQWCWLI